MSGPKQDLLQGTLDLLILQTLAWGAEHGLGISQAIRMRSDEVLQVETGSLYPALHRLERAGLLTSSWNRTAKGQRAKYYRLTAAGRKRLAAEVSRWKDLSTAIGRIVDFPGGA